MSNKKKILVVQKIHDEGIKLIENNPAFEFDLIDFEEMVETIDELAKIILLVTIMLQMILMK